MKPSPISSKVRHSARFSNLDIVPEARFQHDVVPEARFQHDVVPEARFQHDIVPEARFQHDVGWLLRSALLSGTRPQASFKAGSACNVSRSSQSS